MVSSVETSIRVEKELLARFLSCKGVARSLAHALLAARSEKMKAHQCRQMSSMGSAVEAGALARC
jgi:hypothetical protein